jgi:hypothetical protein
MNSRLQSPPGSFVKMAVNSFLPYRQYRICEPRTAGHFSALSTAHEYLDLCTTNNSRKLDDNSAEFQIVPTISNQIYDPYYSLISRFFSSDGFGKPVHVIAFFNRVELQIYDHPQ